MAVVSLRIVEPAIVDPTAGFDHVGTGALHLRGEVLSGGHPPLFFKWYSSLVQPPPPPAAPDASIPVPPGSVPTSFDVVLPVGSQVLTFTAKDVAGDSRADLESVQDAGMAGGPIAAGNPAPCMVHVYRAEIIAPSSGATLSKASSILAARAPVLWKDPNYQLINAIRYRWHFTPDGPPAGRAAADLTPTPAQLVPRNDDASVVQFQGPLPATLGTGSYLLTLRVERIDKPASVGHEVSRTVVLAP